MPFHVVLLSSLLSSPHLSLISPSFSLSSHSVSSNSFLIDWTYSWSLKASSLLSFPLTLYAIIHSINQLNCLLNPIKSHLLHVFTCDCFCPFQNSAPDSCYFLTHAVFLAFLILSFIITSYILCSYLFISGNGAEQLLNM